MKTVNHLKSWSVSIMFVIAFCDGLLAQQVTQNEAVNAAVNVIRAESVGRTMDFGDTSVVEVFTLDKNDHTLIYEVCFESGNHVLLSGCKSCLPVLGILTRNTHQGGVLPSLSTDDGVPDGLRLLLQDYSNQIEQSLNHPVFSKYNAIWDTLLFDKEFRSFRLVHIPPLISSQWGQDESNDTDENYLDHYAYNVLMDSGYHCRYHCSAGCGAVAMAQILRYWSQPSEIPYRCTQYNWLNMPDKLIQKKNSRYIQQREAVSSLLLGCGTDIQTIYCDSTNSSHPCSSSSYIGNVKDGFRKYGYVNSDMLYRGSNSSAWMETLFWELFNNRPIYYAACTSSTGGGGHAFVCDGYFKDQNNDQYFHFNWGWNGDFDGYFPIDNLHPGGYNFAYHHRIIYQIEPTNCFRNIIMECDKDFAHTAIRSYSAVNDFQNNHHLYRVRSGAKVHLYAGHEILLTDGFLAETGSNFHAAIAPCGATAGFALENLTDSGTVNIDDPVQTNLRTRHSARSAEPQTNTHSLTVYPNPTNDLLHIELAGGAGIANATLYDLQGRTVRTRFIAPANSQTATVDVRGVPAGVYMLRVTDGEGKEYEGKVVKR